MPRLIDVESAIRVVDRYISDDAMNVEVKLAITNMPTVDAEPVRHGHWIEAKYPLFTCSVCDATYQDVGYGFSYCPNCGAKMDERREDEVGRD